MGKARPEGKGEKPKRAKGGTSRAERLGGPLDNPGGVDHKTPSDEELLRHMVDAASEAIVCIDEEARIVFINHAAEELWGYPREEILGTDMAHLMVPEEQREHFAQVLREMISGTREGILGKRHRLPSVNKHGRPFQAEISPSSFSSGGKKYFLAITRDVTEREELEKALRESEERYRILHDNARFGVFSFNPQLVITGVNRVVTDMLGYSEEELVGKGILELGILHPDDYQRVTTALSQIFEGQKAARNDLKIRKKDGTYLLADIVGVPIQGPSGEVVEVINIGADVTEQRRLEEEIAQHRAHLKGLVEQRTREVSEALQRLERSEHYYRALIENTHDLIVVMDEDMTIRYISPSVERISGYTVEEALGRNALDFFHPEDVQEIVDAFLRDLEEKGVTEKARFRYRHKDGTFRWHEATAFNLLDDPAVRGIVVNARDVTESEEAKRALAESEERYRTLVETSPDTIVVTDLFGKITMINATGAQMLGFGNPEEVLGRNVLEFIALQDHARAIDSMRIRPMESLVRREDYVLVRRDGTRLWAEISASLLCDTRGKPVGFIAQTRDITERKKVELGLDKLNRCLLSLGHDSLENIANIVLAAREILDASFARYGRKERGGFQVFSSHAPSDGFLALDNVDDLACWKIISCGMDAPVSRKDLPSGVFENDPDVINRHLRESLHYPVRLKGEPIGCLSLFFDEEREFSAADIDILIMLGRAIAIEEDRWDYQEGLRDFIDIASHELRHPLALLGGFSELMREYGGEMDEATRTELTEAILSATDRLKDIAEGLVRASLVERGRFALIRKKEDIVALARHSVYEMERRFPEREFRFTVRGEIGSCSIDAPRIHELLVILLDNAVKYSPSETPVEVQVEAAREGVTVAVLDRGRGVAEESRKRIFERFYQVEKALYHSEGLGLGLFLARQIVEGHGGRIWHEDRPGGGSAFRFFLPYL